ncbi:MAG TPA: hypothetical protein VMH05_08265, partial [Bryobacteraceae bacterium]|nr:hypothetical protein [Bryobacteraceae bacterium]
MAAESPLAPGREPLAESFGKKATRLHRTVHFLAMRIRARVNAPQPAGAARPRRPPAPKAQPSDEAQPEKRPAPERATDRKRASRQVLFTV